MKNISLKKYQAQIVNLIVIIVALFLAKMIYQKQKQNIASLNARKENEMGKNMVLEEIVILDKKIHTLKERVNKKEISLLINTLGYIAEKAGVRLISIKPNESQGYALYSKYPYELTVAAQDYHTLSEFIAKLESHPDIYMVDEIKINPAEVRANQTDSHRLILELKLSTILFK